MQSLLWNLTSPYFVKIVPYTPLCSQILAHKWVPDKKKGKRVWLVKTMMPAVADLGEGLVDCPQSPIFPWNRRCQSLSTTGRHLVLLMRGKLDASTKCPWVKEMGLKVWGWWGGKNSCALHHSYPWVFCSLPSFTCIKRPRWRPCGTQWLSSMISWKKKGTVNSLRGSHCGVGRSTLIWVKKRRNHRSKKSQLGKQNKTRPPPFP